MKYLAFISLYLLLTPQSVLAGELGIAVIVHVDNPISALDQREIRRIFLKKRKAFPDGSQVSPVVQLGGDKFSHFHRAVMRKSDDELRLYWAKILFTGGGKPPQRANDDSAVKALIVRTQSGIGYISSESVDSSVKVVLTL